MISVFFCSRLVAANAKIAVMNYEENKNNEVAIFAYSQTS